MKTLCEVFFPLHTKSTTDYGAERRLPFSLTDATKFLTDRFSIHQHTYIYKLVPLNQVRDIPRSAKVIKL